MTQTGRSGTHAGRLLGLVGCDEGRGLEAKWKAFRRLLLLAMACEAWISQGISVYRPVAGIHLAVSLGLTLALALGWRERHARMACALLATLVLVDVISILPESANHQILAILCALLLIVADPRVDGQREASLQGLRWLVAIGIFWAGVQKVSYGYYFGGEFLAFRLSIDSGFAAVFARFAPADEVARLMATVPAHGSGPYRVGWTGAGYELRALPFLLVSNLTWIAELSLPALLVVRRTRAFAVVATLALLVAIELGAREWIFGGIMLGLVLLYAEPRWIRRSVPLFAVGYALLLAYHTLETAARSS